VTILALPKGSPNLPEAISRSTQFQKLPYPFGLNTTMEEQP
jgi:hypothetical protein